MAKIGLVYSGGLSKGAYQIGLIDALMEFVDFDDIKAVSGASVGALNGYAFATKKLSVSREYWQQFHCPNIFLLYKQFLVNRLLSKTVNALMDDTDQMHCPFYVSALSVIPSWRFRYMKCTGEFKQDWKQLLSGIIVFPFVAGLPRRYKNRLYIDGGIVDNIPIRPLLMHDDIELIIVMHFDPKWKVDPELETNGKIILEIDLSVCNSYIKTSFDFSNKIINTMYASAYDYGLELFAKMFQNGTNDLETIQTVVDERLKEEKKLRALYWNIDGLPTKLNRIFKNHQKKPDVYQDI